jgi:hypothetical protein
MDEKFKKENKIFPKDEETANSLNEVQVKAMVEIKKYFDEKYQKQNKIIIEKNIIKIVPENKD